MSRWQITFGAWVPPSIRSVVVSYFFFAQEVFGFIDDALNLVVLKDWYEGLVGDIMGSCDFGVITHKCVFGRNKDGELRVTVVISGGLIGFEDSLAPDEK
mmetsp:Transcript_2804/g.6021  ORF Transcript_2804/g.6021 Transcript_2804/m.6021 type:complete len:100 (-) Transcript_2804:669-968(-)